MKNCSVKSCGGPSLQLDCVTHVFFIMWYVTVYTSPEIRAKWESANLTLNRLKMTSFGDGWKQRMTAGLFLDVYNAFLDYFPINRLIFAT